jgi:hypothetical protein
MGPLLEGLVCVRITVARQAEDPLPMMLRWRSAVQRNGGTVSVTTRRPALRS